MTKIYKIRSEIWVAPSPEIWQAKTSKFRRDFRQLRDLIANISGKQRDIVNRKTALQTADTPTQANLIWCHRHLKRSPEQQVHTVSICNCCIICSNNYSRDNVGLMHVDAAAAVEPWRPSHDRLTAALCGLLLARFAALLALLYDLKTGRNSGTDFVVHRPDV